MGIYSHWEWLLEHRSGRSRINWDQKAACCGKLAGTCPSPAMGVLLNLPVPPSPYPKMRTNVQLIRSCED